MSFKFLVAAAALIGTAPAFAQNVLATHTELSVPAGKSPVKIYRPIARDACTVGHRPHQGGKLPMMHAPTVDADACAAQVASRDDAGKKMGR